MLVPEPDSVPDHGARPCAGPKIYEMLKFDEIQVFSVFIDMNDVNDVFSWFSGENVNFEGFSISCEMSGL